MTLSKILSVIQSEYSGDNAKKITAQIYEHNKLISFDAYADGAKYCAKELREIGAEKVELMSFPTDGKTMYGNWRSPKFWSVKVGYLELNISGKWIRFADYPNIPTSIFTYAAPTNGIVETILVPLDHSTLKNSLCFCEPTEENITHIVNKGAIGVATDFSPNWEGVRGVNDFLNGHRWDNASLFEFQNKGLAGFSLSRKQGKIVRATLEKGNTIPCRYNITGKLGTGKIYAVTGIIKGQTKPQEEAVCVAHLYEAGANDNASGVAGAIDGLRTIIDLIKKKKITPPSRTIRVVFTFEIVGFMAYFEKVAKEKRKYIAGVNPDMIGEDQKKCRSTLHLYRTPLAMGSFADALLAFFLQKTARKSLRYTTKNYIINDNVVCDSAIGIPCPALIHLRDLYYHSNEDDMTKVSANTLQLIGSAMTAFLYTAASINRDTATEIATLCLNEGVERIKAACSEEIISSEKRDFLIERELARIRNIEKNTGADLVDIENQLLKEVAKTKPSKKLETAMKPALAKKASNMIPVRTVIGPMTLEHLPLDRRKKYRIQPAWSAKWHLVLSWVDGKRNMHDIYRLSAMETGNLSPVDFMDFFEMLKKEKLIQF